MSSASIAGRFRKTTLILPMLIIVDASAIVDALFGVGNIHARILQYEVHAPVTVDAEVLHAVRRKWLAKLVEDYEASLAVDLFQTFAITRHPVAPFVKRMWSLRRNITSYDAGYVALAESLTLPLLTRDWRLAHSSGHTARIEYIA
jgi:predicted nucleic acid-binding protein